MPEARERSVFIFDRRLMHRGDQLLFFAAYSWYDYEGRYLTREELRDMLKIYYNMEVHKVVKMPHGMFNKFNDIHDPLIIYFQGQRASRGEQLLEQTDGLFHTLLRTDQDAKRREQALKRL